MLAKKYAFLESIGPLPKMVETGLNYLGIKEYPGTGSNNRAIMQMAQELGIANIYKNDEVAWCGLFVAYVMKVSGKPMTFTGYEILRAASFADWGKPVARGEEKLGDILVFKRPGGNHVGIYIAESDTTFHVLGGNQSNAVTITEIAKNRLFASRRFYAIGAPESAKKYTINSSGEVSTNEA